MANSSFLILACSVVLSYENGKQPLQNILFCQLFDEISRKAVKRRLPSTKSGHHQGHNRKPTDQTIESIFRSALMPMNCLVQLA